MTARPNPVDATASLYAAFREVLPAYSPCPLWWWSGEPLKLDRLKWQLENYREGGVWNLVVINLAPSGPLYGHFADDPPFMSEAWWEIFRGVCEHARHLGMRLWFYDQIGFSGANIQGQIIGQHPDFAGTTIERITATGKGTVTVTCPSDGLAISASVRPLDGDWHPSSLPEPISVNAGSATWVGTGSAQVSLFYAARRGFDYYNPIACATLIDTIHGEFAGRVSEYMPDVLVGSFMDELPSMPRWSSDFTSEFTRLHGYDPEPWLDALWDDLDGDERRIRHDYHATRAALAERAFFEPLARWHDEQGLMVGVDQQNPARSGDPTGGVKIYADYLKTHRWFSAPGSDHHGEAKIHSSLAHLYGRKRVWIESFHTSGWGGTLEQTFDWLLPWLRAGANLYNPHATYYSTRGGWFEWAPPSTDWRQPYWAHYRGFADAIARLCRLLSTGSHTCDVGLAYPTATIQAGLGLDDVQSPESEAAHTAYQALVGHMAWHEQETGLLDAAGVDYDILDDDSIAASSVDGDRLRIGEEAYRTIILPSCTVLERSTATVLLQFISAGGKVLAIGNVPVYLADGAPDPKHVVTRLVDKLVRVDADTLRAHLAAEIPLVQAPVPTLVRQVGSQTVVFVPAAFPGASRVTGWPVATIDFDRERYASEMTIRVRDVAGCPEVWDPFHGTHTTVPSACWQVVDGGVEVNVPFHGSPCAVLVWGSTKGLTFPVSRPTVLAELSPVWDVTLEPTLDNRWGDFTFPPSASPFPIQHWTFDAEGVPDPIVATFGPRAQWIGPATMEEIAAADDDIPWQVLWWSLSRGIAKDPLHRNHLGPAGHVPEEFMDFGAVMAGQAVRLRTRFNVDDPEGYTGWFMIGAAAGKQFLLNGEEVEIDPAENARYQTAVPVELRPGTHMVDITLVARHDIRMRAWMALTTALSCCRRPDRLTTVDGPVPGTTVRFETTVTIGAPLVSGTILVSTRGPARILIDGVEVGRQGGYLPYGDGSSTHPYDITSRLMPGDHVLAVEIKDIGIPITVVVDGVVRFKGGLDELWLMTDTTWTVSREGAPVPLAIEPRPSGDPQLVHLRQRPHPLPGAAWLEGKDADTGIVRATAWYADDPSIERLSCTVPPGALQASIPVMGRTRVWVNGVALGEFEADPDAPWVLNLPHPEAEARVLELETESQPGFSGGAILTGPITYNVGPGRLAIGNWKVLGLRDYSGIVRYRQSLALTNLPSEGSIMLDLGDVRGSVEVWINGHDMGIQVVAPFRFDVTKQVRDAIGLMMIEVRVANTLGPYLEAASPTPFVLAGQTDSGMLGPVQLMHVPTH